MIYRKEQIPIVRILFFFILGILFTVYNINFSISFLFLTYIITWILLICFKRYKLKSFQNIEFINGLHVWILTFLAGALFCNQAVEINRKNHFSKFSSEYLIVQIKDIPTRKNDIERFVVEVHSIVKNKNIMPVSGNLLFALKSKSPTNFKYGEKLVVKSKFNEVDPPFNRGEFDFKQYLWFKKVYHQTFINEYEVISLGKGEVNIFKNIAINFCLNQVRKFKKYIKNQEAYAVASILILGYRSDLSADLLQTYSNTGTIHVLSVSGMHVAIIAVFLEFLLQFLNRNKYLKILKTIIIISVVWFYAVVAGLQPSVERSAIMISFFMIGKLIFYRTNNYNILALSALIILIHLPLALFDVGFQLSYIAVAGLIYLQPKIYSIYMFDNAFLDMVWKGISVSLAAQIATAGLSIYYFHQFPLYFLISNLFIALPAIAIMLLGVLLIAIPWANSIMQFLSTILENTILFTNNGLRWIENLSFASIKQLHFEAFDVVLFNIIIMLFIISIEKRNKRHLQIALISLLILTINSTLHIISTINQQKIVFYSLRKNAAMAFIKGNEAVILTDLDTKDQAFNFSVKPNLDLHHIKNYKIINPYNKSTNLKYQFGGKIVCINNNYYPNLKVKYQYLLINNNKPIAIEHCIQSQLEKIFILGTNKDYFIKNYLSQLENLPISYHILKKHKGVEIEW